MANYKPIHLSTGKISKEERNARMEAEDNLRGTTEIKSSIREEADAYGLTGASINIYEHIVSNLPTGHLNSIDTYNVAIVADALYKMNIYRAKLNTMEPIDDDYKKYLKAYNEHFKIYTTMAGKLGLNPQDRGKLSMIKLQEEEGINDPLLNVLFPKEDYNSLSEWKEASGYYRLYGK